MGALLLARLSASPARHRVNGRAAAARVPRLLGCAVWRRPGRVALSGPRTPDGGAAAKARLVTYALTGPVVLDPTALAALDNERIQTVAGNGSYVSLPDAQWSDALPKLLQMKLLRSLEDGDRFAGASRALEGVTGDIQLVLDLRKFQIAPNLTAEVEIGSKLLGSNGRIIAMRTFRASAPVEGALDKAFGEVGTDLLAWTARAAIKPSALRAVGPKRTSKG